MAEEATQEKKSSFNMKYVIFAVGILLAAVVVALGVTLAVMKYLYPATAPGAPTAAVVQQEPGKVLAVGSFVVNLADPGKKYYLKCQISVEVKYKESEDKEFADKEFKDRLPVVKDRVLAVLRGKTLEDLQAVDGMNNVKKELVKSLNQAIPGDHFINVYIEEWVLQY